MSPRITIAILFSLALHVIAPLGAVVSGKQRFTIESGDEIYFPGAPSIGAGNNIVPFKQRGWQEHVAQTFTTGFGSVTRNIVERQTTTTAAPHIKQLMVGISPQTEIAVFTLATKDRKKFAGQMHSTQKSILSHMMTCKKIGSIHQCLMRALTQTINNIPNPLRSVLEAIRKWIQQPKGLIDFMTYACLSTEKHFGLPGVCASITALDIGAITANNTTQSSKTTDASHRNTSEDQEKHAECKKDENAYPNVVDQIIVYHKALTTDVEVKIRNNRHIKTLVICVQNGLIVPKKSIEAIAKEFKEEIFPLVSRITGRVRPHPFIYIKIAQFNYDCTINAFVCLEKNQNQMIIKPPPEVLDISMDKKSAKYFSTIAHEYTHMIDGLTKKFFNNYNFFWSNKFLMEGFAEFVSIEYYISKKLINSEKIYPENVLDDLIGFIKRLVDGVPNNLNPKPTCFLDAPEINHLLFNTTERNNIFYQMGMVFMQYISEKFDGKHHNGVMRINKNKTYNIFNILALKEERLESLKQEANNQLRETWDQFCNGFTEYLKNRHM